MIIIVLRVPQSPQDDPSRVDELLSIPIPLTFHHRSINPPPTIGTFASISTNLSAPTSPRFVANNPGHSVNTLTPLFFNTRAHSCAIVFRAVLDVLYGGEVKKGGLGHPQVWRGSWDWTAVAIAEFARVLTSGVYGWKSIF